MASHTGSDAELSPHSIFVRFPAAPASPCDSAAAPPAMVAGSAVSVSTGTPPESWDTTASYCARYAGFIPARSDVRAVTPAESWLPSCTEPADRVEADVDAPVMPRRTWSTPAASVVVAVCSWAMPS